MQKRLTGRGSRLLIITLIVRSLLYALVAFVTVYFGEHAAQWIDENTPKVLLEGLGIGAKMVPAIGFAMLQKLCGQKKWPVCSLLVS